MFAGKKSAQIREILISESAWEEMTCLFAPSLGEFRRWLREEYVPKGFKEYLADKVQQKVIENTKAIEVLENLQRPELEHKKH
ncbi:hypothetical protein M3L74_09785 [Citrobacter freundii]|nr:hypothetical protein [Citrobacter freundii]UQI38027.1 hypothetical protein M3L74_09785 [Citrobacter freundii]